MKRARSCSLAFSNATLSYLFQDFNIFSQSLTNASQAKINPALEKEAGVSIMSDGQLKGGHALIISTLELKQLFHIFKNSLGERYPLRERNITSISSQSKGRRAQ